MGRTSIKRCSEKSPPPPKFIPLPYLGRSAIIKLTCWLCSTNPSTLERNGSPSWRDGRLAGLNRIPQTRTHAISLISLTSAALASLAAQATSGGGRDHVANGRQDKETYRKQGTEYRDKIGLTGYHQVDMLGVQYKPVNF